MKSIYKTYSMSKSKTIVIINFITVVVGLIISFFLIFNNKYNYNDIFVEIIFVLLGVFIILLTWYFTNLNKKSNEIYNLNKELENKINELKKIKHDYGSQISYLYGSYLMGNHERLGKLLKSIISDHSISTRVRILSDENSILAKIVKVMDLKDKDVLIDEKATLEDINISNGDLKKILLNVVKECIEDLSGMNLLIIKTLYNYNYIVISVKHILSPINKDFQKKFYVEKNKEEYSVDSLDEAIELVNKYKGDIKIESNKEGIQFIIKLPLAIK